MRKMEVYAEPDTGLMFHELPGKRYIVSVAFHGSIVWGEREIGTTGNYFDDPETGRHGSVDALPGIDIEKVRKLVIDQHQESAIV